MTVEEAIRELQWIKNYGFNYPSNLPGTERIQNALEIAVEAMKSLDQVKIEREYFRYLAQHLWQKNYCGKCVEFNSEAGCEAEYEVEKDVGIVCIHFDRCAEEE